MVDDLLKRILTVDEIAQNNFDMATKDAAEIPHQAEERVRVLLKETRRHAQDEAEKLIHSICDPKDIDKIHEENSKEIKKKISIAQKNMQRAVDFVLRELIR